MSEAAIPVPVLNSRIFQGLATGDTKTAADASTDMTRIQLRELSFTPKIIKPERATNEMLIRSVALNGQNVIPCELEADSPGARWTTLQGTPESEYIQGSMYECPMSRIETKKITKHMDELRSFKSDYRKLFTDNAIKDALGEIDGKFLDLCNKIVTDTVDPSTLANAAPTPTSTVGHPQRLTGKIQWQAFTGFNRPNFIDAGSLMLDGSKFPGMEAKFILRTNIALMSELTAREFMKWEREEMGGDLAMEAVTDGLKRTKWFGTECIYSIKNGMLPKGRVYFFAEAGFLGKFYVLDDWTVFMKKEGLVVESYASWYGGITIGNVAGVVRADFTI